MTSQVVDKITQLLDTWKEKLDMRQNNLNQMLALTQIIKEQYEKEKSTIPKLEAKIEDIRIQTMENFNRQIQSDINTEEYFILVFKIVGKTYDSINHIKDKTEVIKSLERFQARAEPTLDSLREFVDSKVAEIQKMNKNGE